MTHNEFVEYNKKLANDYVNGRITIKEWDEKTKNVKIDSFDFEGCQNLTKDDKNIINNYFKEENKNTEQELQVFATTLYDVVERGLCRILHLKLGVDNGYSGFYYNNKKMMILGFAEGDMYLTIYKHADIYKSEFIKNKKFYGKN